VVSCLCSILDCRLGLTRDLCNLRWLASADLVPGFGGVGGWEL
jgi:hypothetical protein